MTDVHLRGRNVSTCLNSSGAPSSVHSAWRCATGEDELGFCPMTVRMYTYAPMNREYLWIASTYESCILKFHGFPIQNISKWTFRDAFWDYVQSIDPWFLCFLVCPPPIHLLGYATICNTYLGWCTNLHYTSLGQYSNGMIRPWRQKDQQKTLSLAGWSSRGLSYKVTSFSQLSTSISGVQHRPVSPSARPEQNAVSKLSPRKEAEG